jgi:hypothetical protein
MSLKITRCSDSFSFFNHSVVFIIPATGPFSVARSFIIMLFSEAILFSSCRLIFCLIFPSSFVPLYFARLFRAVFIHLYFTPLFQATLVHLYFTSPRFGERLYVCILFHRDFVSLCKQSLLTQVDKFTPEITRVLTVFFVLTYFQSFQIFMHLDPEEIIIHCFETT